MLGIGSLYANDNEPSKTQSALDMFLFKIGFTALQEEFSNEQKNINLNAQEIKKLKVDISFLLQESIKNKLSNGQPNDINTDKTVNIISLEDENKKLKEYIAKLESAYQTIDPDVSVDIDLNTTVSKQLSDNDLAIKKSNPKKMIVKVNSSFLRKHAFLESDTVANAQRDDILIIEKCDRYGWCKVKGKEEYIELFKLVSVKDEF
jgi:hypothetical protein